MSTRNANLGDLATLLKDQQARKVDLVTPASTLRSVDGLIRVTGSEAVIDAEGVTQVDGLYRPTVVCDEGIADKLGIPLAYLRKLRADRPDLYDANVNGWLHGRNALVRPVKDAQGETQILREGIPGDDRSFLLRTFKPADDSVGVARALLSNGYKVIDHLDALTAALDGVKQAGVEVVIDGADLTDRRMVVRVSAPEVKAYAEGLLDGYRSPFTGASGSDNPTVFAGFVLSNSETGGGAYTIVPRLTVEVCKNGMTVSKDAMRAVHLGGKMDDGLIRWSTETLEKQLGLITAKTKDAVATFLDVDYMNDVIAEWTEAAGRPVAKVEEVRDHTKRLGFTVEQTDGILAQFITGGQMTLGGVTQAITAYAQTVDDGDEAYDLEAKATVLLK